MFCENNGNENNGNENNGNENNGHREIPFEGKLLRSTLPTDWN